LDARLSAHVSRYLKNATIRSSVLTRIAILGAVRAPGYYYAAPDRPISDLVMLASGPVERANLAELEVSRGATVILKSKDSKRAMKDGRTLEQLDIQSGDEIRIPMQRGRPSFQTIVQLLFVFSSLFFAFLQFVQWYYSRQEG
jgi:protein involved in polysaccharide export with SLBB domain